MSKAITININSPSGSHKVVVQKDENDKRTIIASVDEHKYTLYSCSANSEGTTLGFKTDIHVPFWVWYGDEGTLTVDPATDAVALDVAKAGVHYTGTLNPGEAQTMTSLVQSCKFPDLGAA
jgi:hypothetical protein